MGSSGARMVEWSNTLVVAHIPIFAYFHFLFSLALEPPAAFCINFIAGLTRISIAIFLYAD